MLLNESSHLQVNAVSSSIKEKPRGMEISVGFGGVNSTSPVTRTQSNRTQVPVPGKHSGDFVGPTSTQILRTRALQRVPRPGEALGVTAMTGWGGMGEPLCFGVTEL